MLDNIHKKCKHNFFLVRSFRVKRNLPLDFFVVVNLSRSFSHLPWHCLLGKSFLKCPLGIFVFTNRYSCRHIHTYICISKYYRHCIFLCFLNHFKMGLWEIKLYIKDKNRMKKGNKELFGHDGNGLK